MKKIMFFMVFAYAGQYEDEVDKLFTNTGRSQIMHCQYEMGKWEGRSVMRTYYTKSSGYAQEHGWVLERVGRCIKCGKKEIERETTGTALGEDGVDKAWLFYSQAKDRKAEKEKAGPEIKLGGEMCGNPGVPKDSILYPLICYVQYKASPCWKCWRNEDDDWADWKANVLEFARLADQGKIRFTQTQDPNGVVRVQMETDMTSLLPQL